MKGLLAVEATPQRRGFARRSSKAREAGVGGEKAAMHSNATDLQKGPSPSSLVLAPYAERFFEGRRVAVFGDASIELAAEIVQRGARHVHLYDPDAARVSRAVLSLPPRVTCAALGEGDLGAREGAFDVVIVPDLGIFAHPKALVSRLRQLTSPSGVAIIAAPNPDVTPRGRGPKLGYYELYDVVAAAYRVVKMVGQVPFTGYAMVDFALEDEPEVSIDGTLAEGAGREPAYFLALASDRRFSVDQYAIIQLPHDADADDEAEAAPASAVDERRLEALVQEVEALRDARRAAETKVAEEQRRSADLMRALTAAEALPRKLEAQLTEETRRAELLASQQGKGQEQLERLTRELRAHQDKVASLTRTVSEAQATVSRLSSREEAAARKLRETEAEQEALRQRAEQAEHLAAQASDRARAAIDEATRLADETRARQEAHDAEIRAIEAQLRDRGREVAALKQEIDRRGVMVRELVEAAESRDKTHFGPSLIHERERLAHLEKELDRAREGVELAQRSAAAREKQLAEAAQKLADLEARASRPPEPSDTEKRLAQALVELDTLRRALLKEHQERVAIEAAHSTSLPADDAPAAQQRAPADAPSDASTNEPATPAAEPEPTAS